MTRSLMLALFILSAPILKVWAVCDPGYDCTPGSVFACAAGYTNRTMYSGPSLGRVPGSENVAWQTIITDQFGDLYIDPGIAPAIGTVSFYPAGSSSNPSLTVTCYHYASDYIQFTYYKCANTADSVCAFENSDVLLLGQTRSVTFSTGYGYIVINTLNDPAGITTCSFASTFILPCTACPNALKTGASWNRSSPGGCMQTCPTGYFLGNTACTPCNTCPTGSLQNRFCANGLDVLCTNCSAGFYCPNINTQTVCTVGYYCPTGSASPILCGIGNYCPAGASFAAKCSSGYFCATTGGTRQPCPAGTFGPGTGYTSASQCSACGLGNYCPSGVSFTVPCAAGYFCGNITSGVQQPCPAGTYGPGVGFINASQCVSCPVSTFGPGSNYTSLSQCVSCTLGSYSLARASACLACPVNGWAPSGTSVCVPRPGYFLFNVTAPALWLTMNTNYNVNSGTSGATITKNGFGNVDYAPNTCLAGICKNAAKFNGYSSGYLYVPIDPFYTITLSFWLGGFSSSYTTQGLFMFQWDGTGMTFVLKTLPTGDSSYIVSVGLPAPGIPTVVQSSPGSLSTSKWTHMTLTVGNSSGLSRFQVYVDGVLNMTSSSSSQGMNYRNIMGLLIGYSYESTLTATPAYFDGYISDVRYYRLEFTSDQVSALYSQSISPNTAIFRCKSNCTSNRISRCLLNGTSICCSAGQYFIEGQSSACLLCPSGTFSTSGNATACQSCANGTVSSSGASLCFQSSGAGYYYNIGLSLATACPTGTYGTGQGYTSAGECSSCTLGKYSNITGRSLASACQNCSAGTLGTGLGLSACSLCSAGTFNTGSGVSVCQNCSTGSYGVNSGQQSNGSCVACSPGTYSITTGASSIFSCSNCTAGTFSTGSGVSVCQNCSVGFYGLTPGQQSNGSCAACQPGTYSITAGASTAVSCVNCTIGWYSSSGSSVCRACPAGKFSTSFGLVSANDCASCSFGRYSTRVGANTSSSCIRCDTGTYSSGNGASACLPCQSNTDSSAGAGGCTANPGYFLDYRLIEEYIGNGTISAVPDGSVVVFNRDFQFGSRSILSNLANGSITVISSDGRTSLIQSGQLLASDNGYPRLVSLITGEYLAPYIWYKFDSSNCSFDSSGNQVHFVPNAVSVCMTDYYNGVFFPTRVYAIKGDMSGMFMQYGLATSRRVTVPGFNWEAMQSTSGLSIAFWASMPLTSTTRSQFIMEFASGSTSCTSNSFFRRVLFIGGIKYTSFILTDTVVDYQRNLPSEIRPGVTEAGGAWHHHVMTVAPNGSWTFWIDGQNMNIPLTGNLSRVAYGSSRYISIGGSACDENNPFYGGIDDFRIYPAVLTGLQAQELYLGTVGVYSVQISSCNTTCPPSTYLHCTPRGSPVCCGYGTYFLEGESTACMSCPSGTNADGSGKVCFACPASQYLSATNVCLDCVAGTYLSGASQTTCTACRAGTYSSMIRADNVSACSNCSSGTYQPNAGLNTSAGCVTCATGTYQPKSGASSPADCVACGTGKFSLDVTATSPCQSCAAGTFSATLGLSSASGCINCSAGSFSTTVGAGNSSACSACGVGFYAGAARSTACDACPNLSSTKSASATQLSDCVCLPGFFGSPSSYQACVQCAANYYCNSSGQLPCPSGMFSFQGAVSVSQCGCPTDSGVITSGCVCNPGFRQVTSGLSLGGWICVGCEGGSYCSLGIQQFCPAYSTSAQLSQFITDCNCNPGYYWNGTTLECIICPYNEYCSRGERRACPVNTLSIRRSVSQSACQCVAGFKCWRTRQTRLTITFVYNELQFLSQQAIIRQKLALLAGVPESVVLLNSTIFVAGTRRLLGADLNPAPENSSRQFIQFTAHVPVMDMPGDVMLLH